MDPARTSSVSEPSSSSAASASTSSPPAMYDEEAAERERTSLLHPENPTVFYNAQYQTTTTTAYEYYDTPGIYGEDTWSCIIVLLTFWFFVATTLILGVFGMVNLQLTPNSSVLINVNHWFVESIKVEQVNESNDSGPVLYGLYNTPVLDVVKIWSKNHTTIVPIGSYKEWIYVLNKGSQINISYSVNSSSELSVILIVAKGSENLDEWIADPTYPNSTLSWNVIKGNGFIQQSIPGSSTYYVAVGNLNSEEVQVSLNISVKSYLYNTSEAYYKCTVANRSCRLKLFFPDGNSAVLTSPYKQESSPDNWYVKISYGPRWITYFFGIGGMTFLMFFGLHFINKCQFRRLEQRVQYNAAGGSERAPLLTRKDSDLSSWGSSYDSVSDNEEELEEGLIAGPDGKPVKDGEYNANVRRLCAICFDAPRDCFFLPCGHCVSCFTCGTRIAEVAGTCPICRRNIKKVRMIFTV